MPLPPLARDLANFQTGVHPLGELLVRLGLCSKDDVTSALESQKHRSERLEVLLVEAGSCTGDQIVQALEWQRLAGDRHWELLGRIRWHPDRRTGVVEGARRAVGVPKLGRYLWLDDDELALCEGIVTLGSYRELLERGWSERGMLVLPQQVLDLLTRLEETGLVLETGWDAPRRARPPAREAFTWQVPLGDPQALLDRTAGLWRAVASRPAVVGVFLPVLVAAALTAAMHRGPVALELQRLATQGRIGAIYLALFAVLAVHEWGHAAICHARGGPVHRIGLMIYLGIPFGYCDVSSADLLARRDRLAVSLGGLYFQIALSAGCFLVWGMLGERSPWGRSVLDLGLIAGGSLLFALNPFARLDGYYLLADALGLANWRGRSRRFVLARLRGRATETLTPRERAWFWLQGLLAPLTTVVLLGLGFLFWWRMFGRLLAG